MHGQKTSTTLL